MIRFFIACTVLAGILYQGPILSLAQAFDSKSSIRHIGDFRTHTYLHTLRVERLALALLEKYYPELASSSDAIAARNFIHKHDHIKFKDDNAILTKLYRYYGVRDEYVAVAALRKYMEEYEMTFAKSYFGELGHYSEAAGFSEVAKQILWIEKIADLTDRALDPISAEEFGRPMKPASEYLRLNGLELEHARFLEQEYLRITEGLDFKSWVGCDVYLR